MTIAHAARRDSTLAGTTGYENTYLRRAWRHSRSIIHSIGRALSAAQLPDNVVCVAVSGSLGRMEYHPQSDIDLIVVVSDSTDDNSALAIRQTIWRTLISLGLRLPLDEGIFSHPVRRELLTSTRSLGQIDEPREVFGKRIQLLLDSQPILGTAAFESLVRGILARHRTIDNADETYRSLENDLIRYHRSLVAIYASSWQDNVAKWRTYDLKMHHSRVMMFAGLLMLLGEASLERSDRDVWLIDRLKLTPLERVCRSIAPDGRDMRQKIVALYDGFLHEVASADFTQTMATADDGRGDPKQANALYERLRDNGEQLTRTLFQLLMSRLTEWDETFAMRTFF